MTETTLSPENAPPRQPLASPRRRIRARELTILASVVLCALVFGMLNPSFFERGTLRVILEGASTDGLMVIGMTIVIICGGFDLSVGSAMAACGLLTCLLMKAGVPVALAVLLGLLAGAVIGTVNGLVVTRLKINPFITTLGAMSILRGLVWVTTKSAAPTGFPDSFLTIAWGEVFHIPVPIIILAVFTIAVDVGLRNLRYLRQVYFVGSNEDAAMLTGINVAGVKTFAFALTGFLAACAGVIVSSRADALDPNQGTGAELRVIAAVIIGGASLSGGRGTIMGSFLGLLLMQIITTGLVYCSVPPEAQSIAVGFVLILAAIIDRSGSSLGKRWAAFVSDAKAHRLETTAGVAMLIALVVMFVGMFSTHTQRYVCVAAATGAPYWIDSKAGLTDKAAELGVHATFEGPTTVDDNQQIDAINRAIAQHVDGIIVIAVSKSLVPIINKAMAQGIPVVCADADEPRSKRFCFVGTGNFNAGVRGGEMLAKDIGYSGKVALTVIPGSQNLQERVAGYRSVLSKYPGIEIVATIDTKGSETEVEKNCRAIMQSNPDLAGFGCVEAGGGRGASVAVKEAGKVGKVKIIAMDRDEATLQFIKSGVIDASLGQRTYGMTYLALQMLYDLRNGRFKMAPDWRKTGVSPLPVNVDTGSFPITRQNVKYFYHEQNGGKK